MKIHLPKRRLSETQDIKTKKLDLPLAVKIIYIIAASCVPLYLAFLLSEGFSDFFNRYISSGFRAVLAYITSPLPFSLAELAVLLLPVWVVLITVFITRRYGDTARDLLCGIICVCSALALVLAMFTVGFAPAYRGKTLDRKLGLERVDVSAEELYDTALALSEQLHAEKQNILYAADGFSVMPYGYEEMNKKLLDAYDKICDEHDFVQRLDSRIKPVMLSKPMSYTHITGVYTFFTGEANLNVAFPDYSLPFTAAHELSHQRGIARENEANFMAFLVCSASDDAYLRYCAYLNMYEYVASALAGADTSLYTRAYESLPLCVKGELRAYSSFYDTYRDSAASEVSGVINDTFLKMHGTEGTKSYGMVVDLAVAYFKANS